MTTQITQEQWAQYRAAGYTDAQISAQFHVAAPAGIDSINGDDAVFRRPKLPPGSRLVTLLEIEGPVNTSYGDRIFVAVRDTSTGEEFTVGHNYVTAINQNIAKQSLACLVAATGAQRLADIRHGSPTPFRVVATEAVGKQSHQPYVRVDYLTASAHDPVATPSLPPLPTPSLPPLPTPSLPPLPTPSLPPLPTPSLPPPGWQGAWPPGGAA